MKILISNILIFSFLISCGKKENSSGRKMEILSSGSTDSIKKDNHSSTKDSDGDFIPDYIDERPFIADFPNINEILEISNGKQLEVSPVYLPSQKIYQYAFNKLNKIPLPSIIVDEAPYFELIQPEEIFFVKSHLEESIPISFFFKNSHLEFHQHHNLTNTVVMPFFHPYLLLNEPIYIKKLNFKIDDYTYQDLKKSIDQKTYRIILNEDEKNLKFKVFYISNTLTIREALKTIKRGFLNNRIESSLHDIRNLKHISDFKKYTLLISEENSKLDEIPSQDVIIAQINTEHFLKHHIQMINKHKIDKNNKSFRIHSKKTNKMKLKLRATQSTYKTITQNKTHQVWPRNIIGAVICKYQELNFKKNHRQIRELNKHFILKINGNFLKFHNDFYNLEEIDHHHIEIIPKNSLIHEYEKGKRIIGRCNKVEENKILFPFEVKKIKKHDSYELDIKIEYF